MKFINNIKLTSYSHGGGCGCKIPLDYLVEMLNVDFIETENNVELPFVGCESKDDAAIYDLGGGQGLVCTTDFFMPIVDDPFDFGRIAAANAISDIYAMGGRPLSAIAILAWPIQKLGVDVAQKVLQGADQKCREAGIVIAGGHSIDNSEPIFGLAVNGLVKFEHIKRVNAAQEGDLLFLTKPLGVGIFSTAGKKGILKLGDYQLALKTMLQLNKAGELMGTMQEVTAMTDVTGFGLFGHLRNICVGSQLCGYINFDAIPYLPNLQHYIEHDCVTGGGQRNWASYGHAVKAKNELQKVLLSDPQTNGGLLIAVRPNGLSKFEALVHELNLDSSVHLIGHLGEKSISTFDIFVE